MIQAADELGIVLLKGRVLELWGRVMLSKRQENTLLLLEDVNADLGLQMRTEFQEEVKKEEFEEAFQSIIKNVKKNNIVGNLKSCLEDSDIPDFISFSSYMRILRNVIGLLRKKKLTNVTKKNTEVVFKLLKHLFPAALVDKEDTIMVEPRESIATGKFNFRELPFASNRMSCSGNANALSVAAIEGLDFAVTALLDIGAEPLDYVGQEGCYTVLHVVAENLKDRKSDETFCDTAD